MPSTDFTVRAGTSNDIDMQLLNDLDGDGVAEAGINLSGAHHLEMVLVNKFTGGTTIYSTTDASPKVSVIAASAGSVRFTPSGTADLNTIGGGTPNIYNGYWWVYVTASKKYSVPEEFEFTIKVRD